MDALTLYVDSHHISPYAMSAFVALEEKRLPYAIVEVALADGAHRATSYPARTARVPALRHGEYVLAESQAIAEYLAEVFPFPRHPRLFPADLKERGICREIMSWVRSDLMPIREERATHTIWYAHTHAPLSPAAIDAVQRLERVADALVPDDRATLFAEWCIADADLAMMLRRLHANGDALTPKLARYVEANWRRPSLHKWDTLARPPYRAY